MKKNFMYGIKVTIFLLLLLCSLYFINQTLMPKYTVQNSAWPTTTTYKQFYNMKQNSVDVLFLGSSVVVNSYSPQVIYDTYGIRSYNLASEQQSIFLSYYWLQEALRFQNPKVVVLDTGYLYPVHPESPINTLEGLTRKALDPMKWSSVKRDAVRELCELDSSQNEISYYLKNLRYHTRWSDLTENDFHLSEHNSVELKGFGPLYDYYASEEYIPYHISSDSSSHVTPDDTMQLYLDRITELCRSKNISLILVSQPGNYMDDSVNSTLCSYAADNGINYINLCEETHYNSIGAVFPKDNIIGHSNVWGAEKLSEYIGRIIKENYSVSASVDSQYESTKDFYSHILKNAEITHISELNEYLEAINDNHYTIFIASREDPAVGLTDEHLSRFADLGLKSDLKEKYLYSFAAVIDPVSGSSEALSPDGVQKLSGSFGNGKTFYTIIGSGHLDPSSKNSISIDGVEYSKNRHGLTFVIYDNSLRKVIDTVNFNTLEKLNCNR